jgi:hypothetical protein
MPSAFIDSLLAWMATTAVTGRAGPSVKAASRFRGTATVQAPDKED